MAELPQQHPLSESLSALMDNEASELELARLLKASESDSEIASRWGRYQIASSGIRQELSSFSAIDISSRVSAAIAEESAHVPSRAKNAGVSWWQNVARVAIAASVAGGVVLFAGQYQHQDLAEPVSVAATPQVSIPSGYHAQPLSLRTVGMQNGYESRQQDNRQVIFVPRQSQSAQALSQEEVRDYLNTLIESHADNAATNGSLGILPFARVVFVEED